MQGPMQFADAGKDFIASEITCNLSAHAVQSRLYGYFWPTGGSTSEHKS